MNLPDFLADVQAYFAQRGEHGGFQVPGVPSMAVFHHSQVKSDSCAILEPLIGVILQGQKTAVSGTNRVDYGAGDVLIVGQAMPTISSYVYVNPDVPFISAFVSLDMEILRSLYSDLDIGFDANDAVAPALVAGPAGAKVIDAMARLFQLRHDPIEAQALGPATLREIYFWVLRSPHGRALQQLIHLDSKANQIAKALAHIRREYRSTIKAVDLAAIAGMSTSVFYETFKQITASSPLQYQKDMRLHAAHTMLQQARAPISQVALDVGYESASQFSREFSRKFGAPPKAFLGAMSA